MSIFSKVKNKIIGIDSFYGEVQREQIGLYQHYFDKIINSVDIDTQTKWSKSEKYNREQMAKDEDAMEIIANEATREGLAPAILQVMVNQYFFADVYQRELDRHNWVKRVMYRKDVDYFPAGYSMRSLLEQVT